MRHAARFAALALGLLALASAGSAREDKGTVVDLDGLKSTTPATWKDEAPSNKMRFAQFKLPKAKDDSADAELVIFKDLGGTPKQNLERWKAQFVAPKGKAIDDVAKVEEFKVSGCEVTYLDISGSYKFKERPFDPNAKEELRPDYRMLAIHFEGKKSVYHIKLTGPAKTVESYKKGFDEWVKAFK